MNTSPTITKIAAALVQAQSEMGNATKDAINPFFKKTYADLNAIREAVLPVLNRNGICAIQPTIVIDGCDFVETILLHNSGEFISSLTRIVVDKVNDAQRHGSGLSYARRYALQSIVNIGAEDDDANKAVAKQPVIEKKSQVEESIDIKHEVKYAKEKLPLLTTVDELKEFKKILPGYIVKDASFVEAATFRYNIIMAEALADS
jgi:hypothetical protein